MYTSIMLQSRSVAGIDRRNMVENVDELIHQRLAFNTEQEVLKIIVREIGCSARIAPEFDCGYVWFFFSHTVLDSTT